MATNNYRVAVVHKGAYSAGTAYVPLDEVSYNGATYRCKANTTGNVPTNTTYWTLVASKGVDGGILVQATPPSALQTTFWRSTSATVTPYCKNTLYAHNGSYWEVVSGDTRFNAASALNTSTAGAFTDIVFTAAVNNAGGTLSGDGKTYTVGADGLYDIDVWVNAGSNHTWTGGSPTGYQGVLLSLLVDGVQVKEDNRTDYAAVSGSGIRRALTVGMANRFLTAGQAIKAQYFMLQGSFTATVNLSVRRVA